MYIEDLLPGINLEDYHTEFKGIISDKDEKEIGWLKTLAAFANTDGGDMYIGVDNKTHKVLSLDHHMVDQLTLMVNRLVREKITPSIRFHINPVPVGKMVPSRYVLHIHVEHSHELPVTVHEHGLLGIYIRNFGQTVTATSEQIRNMILLSDNIPYDRPMTDEIFHKEDFSHILKYAEEQNIQITEKALISIGFMSSDHFLSKGALLFRDDCTSSVTKVTATLWPGISKGDSLVLASEEFTGDLLSGVRFSRDFIHSHSVNGFLKEPTGRKAVFSYPDRSVLEGVVNAFGHRNYFIEGSQIEINIFHDRLEITSPGALLGVKLMKKETDIASIIPRRRNEVICGMFQLLNLMEEKGSGFDKIEADYSHYDKKYAPYVSSASDYFTLTLPDITVAAGIITEETVPDIYTKEMLFGKYDEKILSYCYSNDRTAKEIAAYLGLKPSTYLRKNIIQPLVNNGYLIASGTVRKEHYRTDINKVFLK